MSNGKFGKHPRAELGSTHNVIGVAPENQRAEEAGSHRLLVGDVSRRQDGSQPAANLWVTKQLECMDCMGPTKRMGKPAPILTLPGQLLQD